MIKVKTTAVTVSILLLSIGIVFLYINTQSEGQLDSQLDQLAFDSKMPTPYQKNSNGSDGPSGALDKRINDAVYDNLKKLNKIISSSNTISEVISTTQSEDIYGSEDVKKYLGIMLYTCDNLVNEKLSEISTDSKKDWARKKLDVFCDSAEFRQTYPTSELYEYGSNLYFDTVSSLETINEDSLSVYVTASNFISNSTDYLSIVIAAAWMTEQQYLHPESMIIPGFTVSDVSLSEALDATQSAVYLYYCSKAGGCGRDHFLTTLFCYNFGCEPYIDSIEQAIYRVKSPRHLEVMNKLLRVYWSM